MKRKILFSLLSYLLLFIVGCTSQQSKIKNVNEKVHPALQMLPVPAGLGVNIHFYEGNKNDLLMLKESGVGIVRMDVSWSGVEKTKGKYDFSRHDKLIDDLEELGIRLLFIIDYGNHLYDDGLAPHTKEGRDAYAKFSSALAERYSGKGIIWELWNEPNIDKFWLPKVNVDDYMAFCRVVVPVIRDKDQNACIIAPATSGFDMKFMESCFEKGLLDLVDGVSVHPYRNPEAGPETTFSEYQLLSLLIDQYKPEGKAIPILSGEWGYNTTVLSREQQGKYFARQWLSNFANNISINIWYDWHDDGQDPEEGEHNFGTVTWDYKEKPSYVAMKFLIKQFKGYQVIGRISLGSIDDYMLMFHKNDEVKLAIWSTSEKHNISLGSDVGLSSAIDYLGNNISNINPVKFEISDAPIYLNIIKPFPSWMKTINHVHNLTDIEAENIVQSMLLNDGEDKTANEIRKYLEGNNTQQIHAALFSLIKVAHKINSDDLLNWFHFILDVSHDLLTSKQALVEIAKIGSEKSIPKIATIIDNPKLFNDASLYYLSLAYNYVIKGDYKKAEKILSDAIKMSSLRYPVDRILSKMEKANQGFDTNTLNTMARSAGFINDWKVIGPFNNKNNDVYDRAFANLQKIDFSKNIKVGSNSIQWQNLSLDGAFPVIPFADLYGREELTAYAFTSITLDKNMSAMLKIGSNDEIVCWVNGEKVHEIFIGRSLKIDEDIVKVNFKKGKNNILIKVLNRGNNWEACLRVCDSNGVPIDLNYYYSN